MLKNNHKILKKTSQYGYIVAGSIILLVLVGALAVIQPVTRAYVATDRVCVHCHVQEEYLYSARMPFTRQHPPEAKLREGHAPVRCVDCHLSKGFISTFFAYTHFVSVTDLFGHFRDRAAERAGDWIPLSAARAYRVRDRLQEYDSETCRSCHVMEEIVPESIRGKTAHKDAIANQETCVECHSNLVHRFVEVRDTEPAAEEDQGEAAGGDEFDEFDEGSGSVEGLEEESGEEVL
jgi:nitrate/TMAO reductase-like tetraheme cytochrome c subunit